MHRFARPIVLGLPVVYPPDSADGAAVAFTPYVTEHRKCVEAEATKAAAKNRAVRTIADIALLRTPEHTKAIQAKFPNLPLAAILDVFERQGALFPKFQHPFQRPGFIDDAGRTRVYTGEEPYMYMHDVADLEKTTAKQVQGVIAIVFRRLPDGRVQQLIHKHDERKTYYGYEQLFLSAPAGMGSTLSDALDELFRESLRQFAKLTLHGYMDLPANGRTMRYFFLEASGADTFENKVEAEAPPLGTPEAAVFEPFSLTYDVDGVTFEALIPRPKDGFRDATGVVLPAFDATWVAWADVQPIPDQTSGAYVTVVDLTEDKSETPLAKGRFNSFCVKEVYEALFTLI